MMTPRAPLTVAPPPVLRPDWETLARLASRRNKPSDLDACPTPSSLRWFCGATDKPRNHCGDFEAQITKPELPVLRPKPGNPCHQFWGQTGRNCRNWFWGQTRENHPSGFEAKPLTNHPSWFWGSTKKPALLISTCTVQIAHSATRPLNRPVTEYPTCATIPSSLHLVSYSCHDPRCWTPCCTCHLYTTR
jgi:hypothetical protein